MTQLEKEFPINNEKIKPKARRQIISDLLIQGYSQIRIAKVLGVSRETVVRDVKLIKDESANWLYQRTPKEFLFHYKMMVEKLTLYEQELVIIKETAPVLEKIKIIKALQENIQLQTKILENPLLFHVKSVLSIIDNKMEKLNEMRTHHFEQKKRDT